MYEFDTIVETIDSIEYILAYISYYLHIINTYHTQ